LDSALRFDLCQIGSDTPPQQLFQWNSQDLSEVLQLGKLLIRDCRTQLFHLVFLRSVVCPTPQLSKTGCSEAITPENSRGSTVTYPERHVQAALSRAGAIASAAAARGSGLDTYRKMEEDSTQRDCKRS